MFPQAPRTSDPSQPAPKHSGAGKRSGAPFQEKEIESWPT